MPALNEEQYIALKGNYCPSCGVASVESNSAMLTETDLAWCERMCTDCEATWQDTYGLTGYTDLKT